MTSKPKVTKVGNRWAVRHNGTLYDNFLSQPGAMEFAHLLTDRIRKECI